MNWNDEEQWKEATVRKKTTVEASKRCSKSYVRRKGYNEATKRRRNTIEGRNERGEATERICTKGSGRIKVEGYEIDE